MRGWDQPFRIDEIAVFVDVDRVGLDRKRDRSHRGRIDIDEAGVPTFEKALNACATRSSTRTSFRVAPRRPPYH